MKARIFFLFFLFLTLAVTGQVKNTSSKTDTIAIKTEITGLENAKTQLAERIGKLKLTNQQTADLLVKCKNKSRDVQQDIVALEKDISSLESQKNKTKEQKQLLRDLKQGLDQRKEEIKTNNTKILALETDHEQSVKTQLSAEDLLKQINLQIQDLNKKLTS